MRARRAPPAAYLALAFPAAFPAAWVRAWVWAHCLCFSARSCRASLAALNRLGGREDEGRLVVCRREG